MEVEKMSYIRIKELNNGIKYKYLVKGVRVEGKVKQKVIKYLGPVNPIYKVGKRRKTNASVYVKHLNNKEITELKKLLKSNNAFTRDRAKILILSSDKLFARQIANKISCEEKKVWKAIKTFNKEGLKALQRKKAKGAAPKFSEWDKKSILLHFSKSPREFKYHFTTWTLPRFRKHLIEYKVVDSICIETVRQILVGAGAKLTKSKRWQYSPDKNFLQKSKE
jgi:biotin operon repressor